MLPKVAIVDPELGAGAPPRLTAACGMDALTQAIESFMSIHATPLTRPVSAGAAKLLAEYLPRSVADGSDLHAREMCATGSLMAGIALHNARLGLVHGIAHPLGAHYGMAHGEACGILLPHVLWFNRETAEEDYGQISDIIGADAADCCLQMLDKFSLPLDLKHLNIDEEGIETLIAETLPSGSTKSNPRPVDRKNLLEFLRGIC
jgi:alcohol dehydrogenase class IV